MAVGITKLNVIIKVALVLNNWSQMSSNETYTPTGLVDSEDWSIIQGTWETQNFPGNYVRNSSRHTTRNNTRSV